MIVTFVHVKVKPEFINEFIEITKYNHHHSIREKGNLRFDFLHTEEDPSHFVLYEVFESEEAIAEHKKTEHYNKWRETVADWMAEPRKGIRHKVISPLERDLW
jgi:autoinducer 2-degrading protein